MPKLDICSMCEHREKAVDDEPCGTCKVVFLDKSVFAFKIDKEVSIPTPLNFKPRKNHSRQGYND